MSYWPASERYRHNPPFHGLLAQLRRAAACRAEGRGSNARTGRHFRTTHLCHGHEEDSNPRRLGRGDTRSSNRGARPLSNSSRGRADLRRPSSKREHAGAIPAGGIDQRGITVVHRPVKAQGLGANPSAGAIFHGARPVSRGSCFENSRALQKASSVQIPVLRVLHQIPVAQQNRAALS